MRIDGNDFRIMSYVLSPFMTKDELISLASIVDEKDSIEFALGIYGLSRDSECKALVNKWRTQTPEEFKRTTYKRVLALFSSKEPTPFYLEDL